MWAPQHETLGSSSRVLQFPGEAAPAAREVLEMDPPACRLVWFRFSAGTFHPIIVDAGWEANYKLFQLMQ